MENAVDALKLAFAVIVFIMALAITISVFNSAKAASDTMLYVQDETNYYDYYDYNYDENVSKYQKRIVGLETVIPTLYKYYKENYTVVFQQGTYNEKTGELTNVEKIILYITRSEPEANDGTVLWGDYYNNYAKYWGNDRNKRKKICSFDINEETQRHEIWSGKQEDAKRNLDCFLSGKEDFYAPSIDHHYDMKYSTDPNEIGCYKGGFIKRLKDMSKNVNKENPSDTTVTIDGEVTSILRKNKKRVITYTLITNQI